MAEMFDAASRLAEGRPAVDTVSEHVWACHLLGYQDSDLTLHGSQLRDWYSSEDGIDLRVLDADCDALRAAAAAAEAALVRQNAQIATMSGAWHGAGAEASREFLRRHGEASASVVDAVRTAAESLAALRDGLWRSIDGKVGTTMAIGSRGERPDWVAAAQTVTTGAGDRATASELVDHEIKPFVDNDIRSEWLTAMRSAMAAVTNAYDAAVAELTAEVGAAFAVPGDLGPAWTPPPGDGVTTTPAGASAVMPVGTSGGVAAPSGAPPAAWSASPLASPPMSSSAPAPLAPPPPLPPSAPPVEPAAMTPPSTPSLGGGMPDIGSGLSGFGQQVGDMLGGLLGTSQDALSDLPDPDEPSELEEPDDLDELGEDDPDDVDEDANPEPEGDEAEGTETDGTDTGTAEAEPVCDPAPEEPTVGPPPPAEPIEAAVEPAPTPAPVPPPAPPPEAAPAGNTPCEIAADELPQVGE